MILIYMLLYSPIDVNRGVIDRPRLALTVLQSALLLIILPIHSFIYSKQPNLIFQLSKPKITLLLHYS